MALEVPEEDHYVQSAPLVLEKGLSFINENQS